MRIKVSRRTDVAMQALRLVVADGGTVPGLTVATATDTSQAYLSQCLAPLIHAGWLHSRTGPDGGYTADPVVFKASLLQLIELVEGPLIDQRCVLDGRKCGQDQPCAMHKTWSQARDVLMQSLGTVKVID